MDFITENIGWFIVGLVVVLFVVGCIIQGIINGYKERKSLEHKYGKYRLNKKESIYIVRNRVEAEERRVTEEMNRKERERLAEERRIEQERIDKLTKDIINVIGIECLRQKYGVRERYYREWRKRYNPYLRNEVYSRVKRDIRNIENDYRLCQQYDGEPLIDIIRRVGNDIEKEKLIQKKIRDDEIKKEGIRKANETRAINKALYPQQKREVKPVVNRVSVPIKPKNVDTVKKPAIVTDQTKQEALFDEDRIKNKEELNQLSWLVNKTRATQQEYRQELSLEKERDIKLNNETKQIVEKSVLDQEKIKAQDQERMIKIEVRRKNLEETDRRERERIKQTELEKYQKREAARMLNTQKSLVAETDDNRVERQEKRVYNSNQAWNNSKDVDVSNINSTLNIDKNRMQRKQSIVVDPEVIKFKEGNEFVYFIQNVCTKSVKIGYATNPYKRIDTLQTGNEHMLILLGCICGDMETERRLHSEFQFEWKRGEWFNLSAKLVKFLTELEMFMPTEE